MTKTPISSRPAKKLLLTLALAALTTIGLASTAQARDLFVGGFYGDAAVVDVNTNALVGAPFEIGSRQLGIAITPDGTRAYFTDYYGEGKDVIVIDTATRAVVGKPITVGSEPTAIAIAPNGARAYVANTGSGSVSVIDTATNTVVGKPIPVGEGPRGIAITPDGTRAFVADSYDDTVSVIDTATNTVIGLPIAVGQNPEAIAIAPDGSRAYVANGLFNSKAVSVIDTATNAVVGAPIMVGDGPNGIAITSDGKRALVTNFQSDDVSVIDLATNAAVGAPIPMDSGSTNGIAITPDGSRAYVSDESNSLGVIDIRAGTVLSAPVKVNNSPTALAIVPDQPPRAGLSATVSGTEVSFSGAGSSDPDGKVAHYAWDFGDGTRADGPSPTIAHTYAPGKSYTATLTVTDDEGCSAQLVFTGQTAYCNGSAVATASTSVAPIQAPPPAAVPIKAVAAKLGFGKLERNKEKGTATLAVTLSGPGRLTVSGKGAVRRSVQRQAAGTVKVAIKAKGKALRKLGRTGKAKLRLSFNFAPTGGAATTKTRKVKLLQQPTN
jgi:YVTN family beta-propeller protein